MLVQGVEQVMPGRAPSILDSPTLARVERARMRQESGAATPDRDSLQNNSLLARGGAIKRGLLWQQRDRLFSRWKERYFVLTRDYLHCFKRCTSGASNMGEFIFKVKLVDVISVEWLNRKSYSAVCLDVGREGRVLLRATDGLEDWFELLEECTLSSKERRRALRNSNEARSRASLAVPMGAHSVISGGTIDSALEVWLLSRHKTLNTTSHFPLCDSVPDLSNGSEVTMRRPPGTSAGADFYRKPQGPLDHRLSLLTDIDLTGCDSGLDTPPSTCKGEVRPSSYRDVFFMAPPNMINDSPRRAPYKHKSMMSNPQGTNSSGSTNCGNTNTGDSSSRGTMLTPGGSFRSNASNSKHHHYNMNGNHPSNLDQMNTKPETPNKNFNSYCDNRNKYGDDQDENERFYNEKYYVERPQHVQQYLDNGEVYSNNAALLRDKYEHTALSSARLQEQFHKHRDRSYSDIQQMDKRQWRLKEEDSTGPRRGSYLVHLPSRV